MTSRRPGPGGSWRRDGPSRGGRGVYDEDGQYSRVSRSDGSRSQIPVGARRGRASGSELYPDKSDLSYSSSMENGQPTRNGRPADYRVKRGQATEERQPFFASRRKPAYGLDAGSSVVRLLQTSGERELIPWLRSESQIGSMMSKIIKTVESVEDKLRTESYNGYSGSIWEADDPISGVLNDRTQDLILRLKKTQDLLTKPPQDVIDDVAECFYLLLSAGHILLVNRDTPKSCKTYIASTMASAAVLALKHGDAHAVLTCTTDHLRDSENDTVLLAFQHVLSRILIADADGQKLFGTAHRVLDAQMDILETRSDEDTATTAIDIIGIISLRHPQAFKTRFRDIVDLLLGWFVDAMPSDSFFESCLKMFALCREKFRGDVEFGSGFIKEFAEHMDTAVKAYRKSLPKDPDVQQRSTFLVFFQVYALLIHALTERIRGTTRVMVDPALKQVVKSTSVSIIKGFTQILQSTDPDFSQFSARINKVLGIVVDAMGYESIHIATLLYLHVRMQQTSALRLLKVTTSEFAFIQSVFNLVTVIITATKEQFPLEAAKDLLGPKSLIFLLADNEHLAKELRALFEAVLANSSEAVKEFIMRSFRVEYVRNIQTLAAYLSLSEPQNRQALLAPRPSEHAGSQRLLQYAVSETDGSPDSSLKPLQGLLDSLADGSLTLAAEDLGDEEDTADGEANNRMAMNEETIGHYCRRRIQLYLLLVQLWLTTDTPLDLEYSDGCYEVLVSQVDLAWAKVFPAIVLSHIVVARDLWQKRCTAIVVKDLMSSFKGYASFPLEDLTFIRKTLKFLSRMLIAREASVALDCAVRWTDHALRTLLSLTSSFSELGIETDYLRLLTNYFFLSFYGALTHKKLVRGTISDLFRTHGRVMRKFLDPSMLDLMLVESNSSDGYSAAFAEAVIRSTPLQIVLAHRYDDRQENPSLMQIDLDLQLAAVEDSEAAHQRFIERCLPYTYNIRIWKRLVWRYALNGARDTQTVQSFLQKIFGLRDRKKATGHAQGQSSISTASSMESINAIGSSISRNDVSHANGRPGRGRWGKRLVDPGSSDPVGSSQLYSSTMVSSIGEFMGATDVASAVCGSTSDGIFGKPENFLTFVETLAQMVAPVVFDHTAFTHKTLLELYVSMKDAGMDVADEWEDIRKLVASSSDQNNDAEATAKKPLEKRRIYQKTGGITAADVTAEPLSSLEIQQLQDRVFMMAEVFERCLERMVYGSALHATSMSAEEWFAHMQIIKNQYGSEEQVAAAEILLTRLKGVLLRLAVLREDSYSVLRLGYPVVRQVLATGSVTGSADVEEVARSTVKALAGLGAPRLIEHLRVAQQSSEFDSGVSDKAFTASKLMAEQRYEEALQSLMGASSFAGMPVEMDSLLAPGELARELATDCFQKLNQWGDVECLLSSSNSLTDRESEVQQLSNVLRAPESFDMTTAEQLIRKMLANGPSSQKDASEMTAVMLKNSPALAEALLPDVLLCLKQVESRQRSLACFTKVDGRVAVLRHVLEGFSQSEQGAYPLQGNSGLDLERLPLEALHTCARWLTFDAVRVDVFNQAVKLAVRSGNLKMASSYVSNYFSERLQLDPSNFSLNEALLVSSDVSSSAKELALIRRGSLSLALNMEEWEYHRVVVGISKQNCVNAVRLIQELPEEYDACVVEIVKNLKHLNSMHTGENESLLEDSIWEIAEELRGQLPFVSYAGNAYEASGAEDSVQGELKELAYRFSMESHYSKPTFEYATWHYDQAFQHLTALQNAQLEDVAVEYADTLGNLDLGALPKEILAPILHSFMQSLPVRPSKSDGFAVLQVMQRSLDKFAVDDSKTGGELAKSLQPDLILAVNEYCQRKLSQVRGSLWSATRLYFESLGKELRPDLVVIAVIRLVDILTVFPEHMSQVWEQAAPLINPRVWKEFLPQLLGRLYHPNALVSRHLLVIVTKIAQHFPNEAIFPIVTGHMMANGVSVGAGECCPNIGEEAQASLRFAYQRLIEGFGPSFGTSLAKACSFATEIQRVSLLWDERWLQYLLSNQHTLRRTLKSAMTSAANKTSPLDRTASEESEEEDSAGDDAAFVTSFSGEMHLGSSNKSSANLPEIDEGGELDLEAIKRQNSNLVVQSREATPEVPEKSREDVQEGAAARKDGKKYIKMPPCEHVPWKSRFNMETYQTLMRPVINAMRELLQLTSAENSDTPDEREFVRGFGARLEKAVAQLEKPNVSVEFDEDALWSPFVELIAALEQGQSVKRKTALSLRRISRLHEIISSSDRIPMPGWSGNGTPVYISRIDDTVAILPTKTKPKKLAFWGSDGYKHTFLCKGLEDLAQDACLMQFIGMANKFFSKKFKHDHDIDRARTYSVVPFGPRAGLIQWVEGSTSLLTVYKSYLERQCFLGKQVLAMNDEVAPATNPVAEAAMKSKPEVTPQRTKFRVTEDELQEAYVIMQEQQYQAAATADVTVKDKAPAREEEAENLDLLEEVNFDSQDEFSPNAYVNHVYNTFLQKSRKDLQRLFKQPALPPRFLPNIHEMYMSYLVKSLRRDPDVNWDKFRLHDRNRSKNIHLQHFKNAYNGLREATREDLLEKEIWFACSSSEEWWMVSRGFARSLAVTSVVGYIIGLGDRHPDNLLIDFHTGEVVHVDYNVAFEKGHRLSIPERVPYRLTQNLTRALGWEGVKGSFRNIAVDVLNVFRKNQSTFSQLMGSYVTNPLLDWTTDKDEAVGLVPIGSESKRDKTKREKALMFASKAWNRVREKLNGSDGPDGILDVPRQVDWTIETATDEANLSRMFEGWIAWL